MRASVVLLSIREVVDLPAQKIRILQIADDVQHHAVQTWCVVSATLGLCASVDHPLTMCESRDESHTRVPKVSMLVSAASLNGNE